jgi:hypothetical protein
LRRRVVRYWTDRDEPERGEQYACDLPTEAIRQLSDPDTARAGRHFRHTAYPETQELPVFKHSYRILYLVKEADGIVEVLRFGTAIAANHSTNERAPEQSRNVTDP